MAASGCGSGVRADVLLRGSRAAGLLAIFFASAGIRPACSAVAAGEPVPAPAAGEADGGPPAFLDEVVPLFTRAGCNQGACHGKLAGQNGFRLSLRGYAPEDDHRSLTRELYSRRVNVAFPGESLLLKKPVGQVPHGGGRVLEPESREHRLLLRWIAAGTPGPRKDEPALVGIGIFTAEGQPLLSPGDRVRLSVRARYQDGGSRDVTWLARFDSSDRSVVEVDESGTARILRPGEAAVRASFRTEVAVVVLGAPRSGSVPPEAYAERKNFIDDHVFAKLRSLGIEPSGPASDAAFLRRAYLDVIGKLPSVSEARSFLADPDPRKRERLVDRLLERPEYADFWALELADLFQNRRERDGDVRGTKGVRAFHSWLREQVARNRPWNELAREVLTASGSAARNPAVGYWLVTVGNGAAEQSEAVASVAQAFLGTRIVCAQCHNHPLERYTQDDYYHFAAFFSRLRLERKDPREGDSTLLVEARDPSRQRPGTVHPRTGRFLEPRPLDRSPLPVDAVGDPRAALAAWITDPRNGSFSGAMVNRLWKHFFGAGLVEPVDDLRESNPPSNPALWQALIREFVSSGYDRKYLQRLILNSRAYQLASATVAGNVDDDRFFSRFQIRRLPAEALLDAVAQATGIPDVFPGYPEGLRAVQLPDPGVKSYFLSLFGRSERVSACACERSGDVTMPQLLHLQNGDGVVKKIRAGEGRLKTLLAARTAPEGIAEELFLASLSRIPSQAELAPVRDMLGRGDPAEEVLGDLFWAILNSKEFSFNH